jgi:hypothetical protein
MPEPPLEHGGELKSKENFRPEDQHPALIGSILNLVTELPHYTKLQTAPLHSYQRRANLRDFQDSGSEASAVSPFLSASGETAQVRFQEHEDSRAQQLLDMAAGQSFGVQTVKSPGRQAARLPITKCRIREITANRSNKWIRPPATWNIVKPPIHAIRSTTNKIIQTLICLSFLAQSTDP